MELIKKLLHVIYEIGFTIISLLSRTANTLFYRGSMHQTLSARTHYEAALERGSGRDEWRIRRWRINRLFFWEDDHCKAAAEAEVARARRTLARNGMNT